MSGAGLRGTGRRGLCQHAAVCVCVIEVLLRCNSRSWLGQLVAHRVSFSGELQVEINELRKKKKSREAPSLGRSPGACFTPRPLGLLQPGALHRVPSLQRSTQPGRRSRHPRPNGRLAPRPARRGGVGRG